MCGDLTIPLRRDWIVVDWSATKNHDETRCTFSQLCYYVISWSSVGVVLYNIIVYIHFDKIKNLSAPNNILYMYTLKN